MPTSAPLYTFADAVDHLLDLAGSDSGDRQVRIAHRCVRAAYSGIAAACNWSYFTSVGRIVTSAPYTTGTVTYDHTGGSSERLLTLSGGTWPSWAASGVVLISNVIYDVDRRLSDTTLQLSSISNPGADISTASGFTIFRDTYTLPADWRASSTLRDGARAFPALQFVTPEEWRSYFITQEYTNFPRAFTTTADPETTGRHAVRMYPPPDAAYNLDHVYRRLPVPVRTEEYATGTTSRTSGSRTVTGSGTAWTSAMAGAVIRFSSTSESPTAIEGDNAFVEEGIVESVEGAGSLTLKESASTTASGKGHTISDLLDLDAGPMLTAFLRRAELEQAILLPKDSSMQERRLAYQIALREAMAADYRFVPEPNVATVESVLTLRGIPTGVTEG